MKFDVQSYTIVISDPGPEPFFVSKARSGSETLDISVKLLLKNTDWH